MSFRTNPDRILDNIDRARSRGDDGRNFLRQAVGRDLDTDVPTSDSTTPERLRRVFSSVERAYMKAAQSSELGRLAARFQSVGDIPNHHARGDVSIAIQYLDHARHEDVGMAPFEVLPDQLVEAKKVTRTSRPDVNALRVLRHELRTRVMATYNKIEPRIRDAMRERADFGHISVQVTMDLRDAS